MGKEKRGPLALELWAKQLVDCYPNISIRNMTSSWRNGLAFCALIHRFRPDLIDYDKLDPADIIGNCSLAFEVAENKLGIPSLLDPLDMVAMECPDRLSVLTYVAQFYNAFKNLETKSRVSPPRDENDGIENRSSDKSASPSPDKKMVTKRKTNDVDEDEIMDKVRRSMPKRPVLLNPLNVCIECKNPVFLSDRVVFMKKLYHRSCFCCSNCKNPLNPHIVDVSTTDGSLFCLEKTCHAELLKNMINESSIIQNKCVPDYANNVRQESDKTNANQSDSSADHNRNSIKLNNLSSSVVDHEAGVHADSHSQGDMQMHVDEKELLSPPPESAEHRVIPPNTPKSTKKFLDFAGALLYNNNETEVNQSSPHSETLPLPVIEEQKSGQSILVQTVVQEEEAEEVEERSDAASALRLVESSKIQELEEEQIEDTPKNINCEELQNKNNNSDLNISGLKSAAEVSIPDNVILTVADRFKLDIAEVEKNKTEENRTENLESEQITSSLAPVVSEIEEIVEDKPLNLTGEEESNVVEEVQDITINDEPITVHKFSEENNQKEVIAETEEGDENKTETSLQPDNSLNAPPSPVPKMRPPKPPPPKFITTPMTSQQSPTPVPRSCNHYQTGSIIVVDDDTNPTNNELCKTKDKDYPTELNPFASEEDLSIVKKEESTNPFEDDEDDDVPQPSPKPKPRVLINSNGNNNKDLLSSPSLSRKNAANFNVPPPRPPPPSPRKIFSPPSSSSKPYNPFEDDDDDDDIGEYDDDNNKPSGVFSSHKQSHDDASSISSKTSDLSSISGVPTPTPRSVNTSDTEGTGSVKVRSRKSRRAPLPPMIQHQETSPSSPDISPVKRKIIPVSPHLMKGLSVPATPSPQSGSSSIQKRTKRRAPLPLYRRRVEPLPEATIKTEFADLEIKLKELERQGIALETKIRSLMEETDHADSTQEEEDSNQPSVSVDSAEDGTTTDVNDQVDEMMVQLWSIINEKNDILRRQTELEYLRRGHRLEEMQSELEFKLRMLMDTPEDQKPPNQEAMEDALIQQLLKLVDERNEVVEWLDYHRQLERDEELLVSKSITEFSNSKTVEPIAEQSSSKSKSKDKKHKDKSKDDKEKKDHGKLRLGIFKKKNKKSKPIEGTET